MKAPEFIKIDSSYRCDEKSLRDLEVGDRISIAFGRERNRGIFYEVERVITNGKKVVQIALKRFVYDSLK